MLIPGFATAEGTARFRDRFAARLPGHFREAQGLWISSIGIGTYLGEPTADRTHVTASHQARCFVGRQRHRFGHQLPAPAQRTRHRPGAGGADFLGRSPARRNRAGHQGRLPDLRRAKNRRTLPPISRRNFWTPASFAWRRLSPAATLCPPSTWKTRLTPAAGTSASRPSDIYYVHNPETQLSHVGREEFFRRLRAAFAALEKAVAEGKIRMYGTATWNAYRVSRLPPKPFR